MENKYYDGSEKESGEGKKKKTNKSVGKTIVDVAGALAGMAFVIFFGSKGKSGNKA